MRCDDFLVTKILLYLAQHLLQTDAKVCSFRQPYRQSLAYALREHEEFHLFSDFTMVSLLCFFKHDEILVKHFFLRERDAVEALHLVA